MAYGLIDYNTLKDISDALREKTNSNANYYPRDMARAISQIKTSDGGLDEPVAMSIGNIYPYPQINSYQLFGFEQINQWDENVNYTIINPDISAGSLSADAITLYYRPGNNVSGYVYGMYVDGNNWMANQSSIMDMSNMFGYASNLTTAICGKYTVSMVNTYYACGNLTTAVCGPKVTNMSNAYIYCSNLRTAACGDSVVDMSNAYYSCGNLTTAVFGNNVKNISNAYRGCWNIVGNYNIPATAEDIRGLFEGCGNIISISGDVSNVKYADGDSFPNNADVDWENFHFTSLVNGNELYKNLNNITEVGDFPALVFGPNMFYNCSNLTNVGAFPNLKVAFWMFNNCQNLTQETYDNFINSLGNDVNIMGAFTNCFNIKNVTLYENKINYAASSFAYQWVPIENVTIEGNITNIGNLFSASGIANPICPDSFTFFNYTYHMCNNIINAVCGNGVTAMTYTYWGCMNLINAACGPNVEEMAATYMNCYNLVNAVCGPNVTNMYQTYMNCYNLVNAVCGPNVTNMVQAYTNCHNLTKAVVGPNVTNMYMAYQFCYNLAGDVTIEKANILRQAFFMDNNLANIAILSNSIQSNAYSVNNAFLRSSYDIRRNIVSTNIESYNNIITTGLNAFGTYVYFTSEEYAEPIDIVIDNNSYSVVRCNYNESLNVYVYCTE